MTTLAQNEMKANGGMPLALHLIEWLDRTFAYLEHISFGVVSIAGDEPARPPLFAFGTDLAAPTRLP